MTSPFAPKSFPQIHPVAGVKVCGLGAGIRKSRPDLFVAQMVEGTTVAGVFTKSLTASSAVELCRNHLKSGQARLLVVNSGNSNAFTGKPGQHAVDEIIKAVTKQFNCPANQVFQSSTGVIGEVLPYQLILDVLPSVEQQLGETNWREAAHAIMTTDTFAKAYSIKSKIGDEVVTITGIAKGSGMIAPDMATMLGYVFTDAKIPAGVLQEILEKVNDKTFNCITVDGDTSTSDTLLLFATGQAKHEPVKSFKDAHIKKFRRDLHRLLQELAHLIVKDGEGAQKFVEITVDGAATFRAARKIGFSIANSPLVKTALAAADANWGRIVMAVGKAGEKASRDKLSIWMGGMPIVLNGEKVANYDEDHITHHLKTAYITIRVDVGVGKSRATVWTCDLTHGYIDINGSYRRT